ncbi:hypothetical protein BJH93_00370 [Kocuria polaris]|nr:hypothetical protein [Kocuria polaris]
MTQVLELSPSELAERRDRGEDVVVLDVRSAAEFEAVHIPGSVNVPLTLLGADPSRVAERLGERRVVLTCQAGPRAHQARERLAAEGVEAGVLAGGVSAYAPGREVVRGAGRWAMDRQVRFTAGALVLTGLAAGRFVSPKLRLLAGGVAGALAGTALANVCPMAEVLGRMPWNRAAAEPTLESALARL